MIISFLYVDPAVFPDERTIFIATHFVHSQNPVHERITPIFAEQGFLAAYDGMEVEF